MRPTGSLYILHLVAIGGDTIHGGRGGGRKADRRYWNQVRGYGKAQGIIASVVAIAHVHMIRLMIPLKQIVFHGKIMAASFTIP